MEWYYVCWPWLATKCVARVCQHQLSFLLPHGVHGGRYQSYQNSQAANQGRLTQDRTFIISRRSELLLNSLLAVEQTELPDPDDNRKLDASGLLEHEDVRGSFAGRAAGVVRRRQTARAVLEQPSPTGRRALHARAEYEVVENAEHTTRHCVTHTHTHTG